MSTGNWVLLALAALLFAARLVQLALRREELSDEPTYPEPTLQLDSEPEQPNDVFGELRSTLVADQDADRRFLERRDEAAEKSDRLSALLPVSRKVLGTAVVAWVLVGIPYLHPSLSFLRVLGPPAPEVSDDAPIAQGGPMPAASVGEAKLPGATYDQQARAKELEQSASDNRGPIAQARSEEPLALAAGAAEDKPPREIEDAKGGALDHFFDKLARVEEKRPGAIARILYYGDSIVASDFVTGKLRRALQSRYGDAGHGYAIIANAWPGWFHIDVSRAASAEWRVSTCVGPYAEDGIYGLGCASFQARQKGVWTRFGTADLDEWGRSVSRFEIEYLEQPGGGAVELVVDGEVRGQLETDGETALAWHTVEVEDGPHQLELRTVDDRPVRLFGVRMERDVPGVTVSALGITGARARFLDKQDDERWAEVLRAAKPDLVVLAFGSNEITDGTMYPLEKYRETLAAVMEQVEKALPEASWMLSGPPDMASNNPAQGHSRPMVHFIAKHQRELAAERGWAFWDQYRAMGGGGSMWSWIKAGLGSSDMFHPTGRGGNVLGNWLYLAFVDAFEKYKAEKRGG